MIRSQFAPIKIQIQTAAPLTGATVVCTDDGFDRLLVVNPAGTIAALTVTLPTEANSTVGQVQRIASTRIITLLTVNGAVTIINAPVSMALGDNIGFQKIAANTWVKIS